MPQQINLHNPVLLAPRKHFSPTTMLQALALWSVGLLALSAWSLWRTSALHSDVAATARQQETERAQLNAAIAAREVSGDSSALQQELNDVSSRLAARQQVLEALGRASADASPTPLLASFSRSLPAPVWLTEIRWSPDQLSLAGQTLQPEALQAWLSTLGPTGGLSVVRVDGDSGRWAFRFTRGQGGAER